MAELPLCCIAVCLWSALVSASRAVLAPSNGPLSFDSLLCHSHALEHGRDHTIACLQAAATEFP